jgi:nucleoside-diphosphate-sugar epimerase
LIIVVFLTSTITGMDSKKIPGTDFKINVSGFSNFLQFIIDNKVSKNLIYISSMTVYSKEDNIPVNENSSKIPPNSYGLSKYLAERIFKYACINNDFNGVVLRLPGLYGGNRKNGFIYNIIKRLKTNKPIDLKIENIEYWETININDATKLITELIKNYKWQKSYEVYNVSYGQKTDLIETARYIKKCLSSKSKINIPKKINYVDFYMDNKKIKKLTNFSMNYFDSLKNHINENN